MYCCLLITPLFCLSLRIFFYQAWNIKWQLLGSLQLFTFMSKFIHASLAWNEAIKPWFKQTGECIKHLEKSQNSARKDLLFKGEHAGPWIMFHKTENSSSSMKISPSFTETLKKKSSSFSFVFREGHISVFKSFWSMSQCQSRKKRVFLFYQQSSPFSLQFRERKEGLMLNDGWF